MEFKDAKSGFEKFITYSAIACNIIFVLWILYNGISENFQGTNVEKVSYIALMVLLAVNAFLLVKKPEITEASAI
jgi:hypothetical protein